MNSRFIGKVVRFNLNNDVKTGVIKGYSQSICNYLDGACKTEITFKIVEDGTGLEFNIPSNDIIHMYEWRDPLHDIEKLEELGASIRQLIKEAEKLKKIAKSLGLVYEDSEDEDPEWKQPTGFHDSYTKGAKVIHKGEEYISKDD